MKKIFDYIVLGGGITGLSAAYFVKKKGLNGILLEQSATVGGVLQSKIIGDYQLDYGANSASLTPEFENLINDLNLNSELLSAEAISNKRFLVSNNQFHAVEPNPVKIIKSKLLTTTSKFKLFTESWRKKKPESEDESVAEFVTRRFGKEILEKVFDPVLSGIYAGDVKRLSMQQVMPSLVQWEKDFGSVTKGVFKNAKGMKPRKIINFKGGFSTLINALENTLKEEINCNAETLKIERADNIYEVTVKIGLEEKIVLRAKNIISTIPAYALSRLIFNFDNDLSEQLYNLEYTPMHVLHIAFKKADVTLLPLGFGFLVPSVENRKFLGAINQSLIFPEKAPSDVVLLTVFHKHNNADDVIADLKSVLKTSAQPIFQEKYFWRLALPQFNVGYKNILDNAIAFEKNYSNFYIQGNWRTGVAVGNIITNSFILSDRIKLNFQDSLSNVQ